MDTVSFPADSDLISIAKTACEEANPDIKVFVGRIVTGDQFIAERTVKNDAGLFLSILAISTGNCNLFTLSLSEAAPVSFLIPHSL